MYSVVILLSFTDGWTYSVFSRSRVWISMTQIPSLARSWLSFHNDIRFCSWSCSHYALYSTESVQYLLLTGSGKARFASIEETIAHRKYTALFIGTALCTLHSWSASGVVAHRTRRQRREAVRATDLGRTARIGRLACLCATIQNPTWPIREPSKICQLCHSKLLG